MIDVKFYSRSLEEIESVLLIQRNINKTLSVNIDKSISDSLLEECIQVVSECIGVSLTKEVMSLIFKTYPKAKVEAIEFGVDDTEAKSQICSAVTNFFLGCDCPSYGDKIDINKFYSILKTEADKFKI